jgi:hypothetical protein
MGRIRERGGHIRAPRIRLIREYRNGLPALVKKSAAGRRRVCRKTFPRPVRLGGNAVPGSL